MLRTITTRSAKNLPSDMAKDAEVESRTNSIIRSAKNLPSDIAEDAEVGGNNNDGDDKTIKRSPFRKSSGPTEYLISLRSNADSAPFEKK